MSASVTGKAAPKRRLIGPIGAIACAIVAAACLFAASPARAIEAIQVEPNQDKIDITAKGELYEGRGDRLQIETAAGADGYIGRMAVSASTRTRIHSLTLARVCSTPKLPIRDTAAYKSAYR